MTLAYLPRPLVAAVASAIVLLPGRLPGSAAVAVAGAPAVSLAAEPDPPTAAPAAVVRVYRKTCLKCHDTDGKGEIVRDVMKTIPDFTDAAWHATRNDTDLRRAILDGKGKSMPAMRAKLGSTDVGQLIAIVRGFRGGKQVIEEEEAETAEPGPAPGPGPGPASGPAARPIETSRPKPEDVSRREVGRIFQRSCAACHGNDGRGSESRSEFPSIPDFTAGAWQESRADPRLLVSILDGRGTGMPAFRDKLSRDRVRELVAFIRSLGPSASRATPAPRDDFEERFRMLVDEFEELRRKSRALSADGPPGPGAAQPSSTPPAR